MVSKIILVLKNKVYLPFISILLILNSCNLDSKINSVIVKNIDELNASITQAKPGDEIILANGIWNNVHINFYGNGTKEHPITLKAETPGKVFIEGQSYLHLGGKYLVVNGFYFRNGYTPLSGIIRYKIGDNKFAFNCRVTSCVIEGFTQPNRLKSDRWVEFYGKNNQLDHCYIDGKANDGNTLMVYHDGNENTNNHHQIVYNYFGPRPRKGGPRAETIRIGNPQSTPGYVNVSNNYFEACNGEVEIISDKADDNIFRNNIFYKCEGSLVLRHANYATVDGNIFIGDDDSDFYGGIRMGNIGHWITNNYFYKIKGEQFRSPLAMMNGTHLPIINRYKQVSDVVVAYNTWVDCKSPIQVGVGQNIASANVLPKSEIRDMPPVRSTIANNIIYNTKIDEKPFVNHSEIEGILFKNNLINNNGKEYSEYNVLKNSPIKMEKINNWLYVPNGEDDNELNSVFAGFDFDKVKLDVFGSSRINNNSIGAITNSDVAKKFSIDKKKYGPEWFATEKTELEPNTLQISSKKGALETAIKNAKTGDIIQLNDSLYTVDSSLKIDKKITILSTNKIKSQIVFKNNDNKPAFEINPKGNLNLKNISIKGNTTQIAIAPLKENMATVYYINIENCEINNFDYVLKAFEGTFADSITVNNTIIKNCDKGIELAADEKGNYNAEMVTFNQCEFVNVNSNVINFFRDGYDESTIGGFLTLTNNIFTDCGSHEKSNILIKTSGIINVNITGNTFKNNPVKLVALLWGAKNNHHANNTIINSGEIKVEEQQKLQVLY